MSARRACCSSTAGRRAVPADRLDLVVSEIAPVAHATVGNDDVEVDRATAGEVMLF
jgi:hypothetical protein